MPTAPRSQRAHLGLGSAAAGGIEELWDKNPIVSSCPAKGLPNGEEREAGPESEVPARLTSHPRCWNLTTARPAQTCTLLTQMSFAFWHRISETHGQGGGGRRNEVLN